MMQLPYSQNAEMAVIGSILSDSSLMSRIDFLSPDDFYMLPHKLMFQLVLDEHSKGNNVDVALLFDKVTDEMGGIAYFSEVVTSHYTSANTVSYARKVVDLSIRRDSIKAYQDGIAGLLNTREDFISEIAQVSEVVDKNLCRLSVGDHLDVDKLIDQTVEEMEKSLQEIRNGISTGVEEIDQRLGYQNLAIGEITFFGAPSKNGKTLFANTVTARCELEDDECCHVFSVEMPAIGMFNGIVSAIAGVPANFYARQAYYSKVKSERYDEWMGKWGKAAQDLREKNRVSIDDKKDVTMMYICSEMRKQHQLMANKGKKLRLVVIDHLHRISFDTSKKQMTYAMGDDVRMLKNTASELGVAVLLLGQLNENSKDRDPTAFDILDTSRVRHEIQCFIGFRIFRENGGTYFGIYSDAQRYADHETKFHPGYMQMIGGVVKSLDEHNKHWQPSQGE